MYSPAVRHLQVYGDTFVSALMTALRIQESTGDIYTSTKIFANEINATSIGGTTPGAGSFTTLSATGTITKTNLAATDSLAFSSESSTTGANYYRLINAGGTYQFGVENSAATFVGVAAYDAFVTVPATRGYSVQIAGTGTIGRFTSTGLSVTGTLSATSSIIAADGTLGTGTMALYFGNDINTGIYRGGADDIRMATGGADRLAITNAGLSVTGTLSASSTITGQTQANIGTTGTQDFVRIVGGTAGAGGAIFSLNTGVTDYASFTIVGNPLYIAVRNSPLSSSIIATFIGTENGQISIGSNSRAFIRESTTGDVELGGAAGSNTVDFYVNNSKYAALTSSTFNVTGGVVANRISFNYDTSWYLTDGTISNYSAANYVYVNGNAGGGLMVKAAGSSSTYLQLINGGDADIYASGSVRIPASSFVQGNSSYQTYTSAGHSISLSAASEQWVQLCTLSNRSYARIRIGTGSANSEEEAEITIATSYYTDRSYIKVDRGTYNNHIREVRITGSSGGNKTVFVKIRADTFGPTMVWKLIEARGFVSIDNSNTTPGSGESLVVGNHYRLTASNGVVLIGPNAFPLEDTYYGYSSTYRVLRIGQNTALRSLAFNVDPTAIGGGSFTGNGQILIGNNSVLAPNSGATDWTGVLRCTSDALILGPSTSSGEVSASGGNLYIGSSEAYFSGKLGVGGVSSNQVGIYNRAAISTSATIYGYLSDQAFTAGANNQIIRGMHLNAGTIARGTYTGLQYYGLFLDTPPVTGTGTILNSFQIYLASPPTATNSYGIYQAGDNWNYLAGVLEVKGNVGSSALGVSTGSLGSIQCYNNAGGAAMMAFHRSGSFACYFGLDTDNVLKVGGWSMGAVAYPILHSNNYNSYAPTLTGGGASGTWGINITGTVNGNSVGTMASRNVTIQSGGSPSGGSDGDVYFIY